MYRNEAEVPTVKPRSRKEIEHKTAQFIRRWYPEHWETPGPAPVIHLFEFLLPKCFGVETSVRFRLPHGVEGIAYPRNEDGVPEIVLLESVFERADDGIGRDRFTTGHECGHGLMHTPEIRTQLVDGRTPALFRRQDIPAYLDPEWQADVFAASFLMPTAAVQAFVKSSGANQRLMATVFKVSFTAAGKRLKSLRERGLIS